MSSCEDTGEIEPAPVKAKGKMLLCEKCGADIVPERMAARVLRKLDVDWAEFRRRSRLCPECRRKKTAVALALSTNRPRQI